MSDQNLAFNQFVPLLVCVCASGASYWIYRNTVECIGDTFEQTSTHIQIKITQYQYTVSQEQFQPMM